MFHGMLPMAIHWMCWAIRFVIRAFDVGIKGAWKGADAEYGCVPPVPPLPEPPAALAIVAADPEEPHICLSFTSHGSNQHFRRLKCFDCGTVMWRIRIGVAVEEVD
jgi:hypothetical protein